MVRKVQVLVGILLSLYIHLLIHFAGLLKAEIVIILIPGFNLNTRQLCGAWRNVQNANVMLRVLTIFAQNFNLCVKISANYHDRTSRSQKSGLHNSNRIFDPFSWV